MRHALLVAGLSTATLLAACASSNAPARAGDATRGAPGDDALVELLEVERQFHPLWVSQQGLGAPTALGDPSWEAHEAYAMAVANVANRASDARELDTRILSEMAHRADHIRNSLLACREPLWNVARFDPVVVANEIRRLDGHGHALRTAFPGYVRALIRNYRAGIAQGHVAEPAMVDAAVRRVDAWLAADAGRDDDLWLRPALRHYRTFLADELRPHAATAAPVPGPCADLRDRAVLAETWELVLEAWVERYSRRLPR